MRIVPLVVLSGLLLLASCKSGEVDTEAPTLIFNQTVPNPTAAEICGQEEDEVFFLTGNETFDLVLLVQDNVALSQYKVDIHNNFDCHGHGGASTPGGITAPNVMSQTEDWTILDIQELEGTTETIFLNLEVPENVTAGTYHFQVQALDEAGNDDPSANIFDLILYHPDDKVPPVVSVSEPSSSNFSAAKGSTINFTGSISDNYSLSAGGNGLVFISYTDLNSGNVFTTNSYEVFDDSVEKEFNFNLEVQVPNTLVTGPYLFTVHGHDGVRNVAEVISFEVEVTN